MEITFNKCVRCHKSMRNRLGIISLERGCCPYCKLHYRHGNGLPFMIIVPWYVGLLIFPYYLIILIASEISVAAVSSIAILAMIYLLYFTPLVSVCSTRQR